MTPEEQAAAAAKAAEAEAAAAKAKADADAAKAAEAEAAKAKAEAEANAKKTYDHEYVERLRREKAAAEATANEHAKKLAEHDKAKADAEAAAAKQRGEYEKLYEKEKADRAADTARINARLVDAELKARAAAAGMVDPADALALIDRSKVTISEAGEVADTAAMFEALKTSKPYLFKGATTESGQKGGTAAPLSGTGASGVKVDAFALPKEEFDRAWASLGKKN